MTLTNLWYELKYGIREERPNGQADEVGEHFGEVRLLGEGDQKETKQSRQVDHSDRQKPIAPNCQGKKKEKYVNNVVFLLPLLFFNSGISGTCMTFHEPEMC